jgi:hypothetical protein
MNCDHDIHWDDQQSEPHKGYDYYFCSKCGENWATSPDDEELV